jgi:hypothetical protein
MTDFIPLNTQTGEVAYAPIDLPPPAPHPVRPGVEACTCDDPTFCSFHGCWKRARLTDVWDRLAAAEELLPGLADPEARS